MKWSYPKVIIGLNARRFRTPAVPMGVEHTCNKLGQSASGTPSPITARLCQIARDHQG
jgi:hypothetical protein